EGRKYAFGLIVASQNPSDLSPTILSNAGTLLSFRLMHSQFRDELARSLQCPPHAAAELERFGVGQALCRLAFAAPGAHDGPFVIGRIAGEEAPARYVLEVEHMELELDRENFRSRLWRLGCTPAQMAQVAARFEQSDRSLSVEELSLALLSFGISRAVLLSFLRELGVPDSELAKLFARLQARRLGAQPAQIHELVVVDERAPKN
ncbi:MAG: ATP-binding protein, partial [Candidatus Micrarchaeota archaeon]|nr:ATP-binding protein [Candidatus Micrarchaeota archaeon]